MKLSEKIDGRIRRQGWFRVGGVLILAIALASVQAPAQQLATPLATAGESVIAPELAQAHPVIAQYHWSKLPNHAGKHNYGHHGHCHREYPSAGTRSAGCRLVGREGHLYRCRTGNRL